MKIDEQIRLSFNRQQAVAKRLKTEVDRELTARKRTTWHYESRTKGEESFALKIEAGRAANPEEVDDAFACVIVVPNFSNIEEAQSVVTGLYALHYQRPISLLETTKPPADFRFDDLRLYVRYRDSDSMPPTGLDGTLFEVQVRTFLQHAWTVATHDVVYKAEDVSWRRERIASHAKAALEQAEVTIESMAALEKSAVLPESSKSFDEINTIISALKENWDASELPEDVKRLADGVHELLRDLRLNSSLTLEQMLATGRARYGGRHNQDWSPYRAILQYIVEQCPSNLKRLLTTAKSRPRVFIYPSVLDEIGISRKMALNAILLSA
jgi:ppGpp synthetase/RelA/SpoT-type nucleotidyltranferase